LSESCDWEWVTSRKRVDVSLTKPEATLSSTDGTLLPGAAGLSSRLHSLEGPDEAGSVGVFGSGREPSISLLFFFFFCGGNVGLFTATRNALSLSTEVHLDNMHIIEARGGWEGQVKMRYKSTMQPHTNAASIFSK
jgi:hypothetical protein